MPGICMQAVLAFEAQKAAQYGALTILQQVACLN